jgi:hypothetical protein
MDSLRKAISSRDRGAALIIVLAFVVVLTGLVVAYMSRVMSDRPVAHGSFNQSKADQLAQSAMDNVIGDLRQEITNGSTATTVGSSTVYMPKSVGARTSNDNMLPVRNAPNTIPNLVRISVQSDGITAPARVSRASAVNSTNDFSANGRSISLARWNKHYLIPRDPSVTDPSVTTPISDFAPPDWVFVTNNGATVIAQPSTSVIGRYAYAVYDEGGLVDVNVAGYPSNTTTAQFGLKGPPAFADLTVLGMAQGEIDAIVGWRNYASAQLTANTFPTFTFTSAKATNYVNFVLSNTNGFMTVGTNTVGGGPNTRTDQAFVNRQTLIQFRQSSGFAANVLQYLGTFLRELNAPSWTPSRPAGSTIDYANLATIPTPETSTAINRNLLSVRVINSFTRADGSVASIGEPLIEQRFPLTRLAGLGPSGPVTTGNPTTIVGGVPVLASDTTVQRDFGLQWDGANTVMHWNYVGASGSTVQSTIEQLDQVAAENREANFFELLKAAILNGSVGLGSGSGNTFVAAETKYYSTPLSSDYQIMQIGANIIDQWDSDNIPTFINFANNELAGTENLPYLNKLVFKPSWKKVQGKDQFAAWLLPSLWNPHQNAPGTGNVQVAMTSGTMTASLTYSGSPGGTLTTTTPVVGSSTQFMTINASNFGTSPSAPTNVVGNPPSSITQSPDNYYGFNFSFATTTGVTSSNSLAAYPDFGTGCDFELQIQVSTSPSLWKAYQRWKGCGPGHPLVCQSPPDWTVNTLQDPEFVTLDSRTLRFGVWGNSGTQSGVAADYTAGTQGTLDWPGPPPSAVRFERITALRPQGGMFASSTSTDLYKYANNNDPTVYYTDLDGLKRPGDVISGTTTAMLPSDLTDRPRILSGAFQNGVFQSVAELGQVFRDQPWKTLDFTTAASADAGLLDVFTLHESGMEAGKTSLNTRQSPILTAILSQATKSLAGTSAISTTERNNIVTALTNLTTAQPMLNKAELVTRLAADPSVTGLGNKEARECVIRAFSDACQTRTWNLLIDVVAQSGRYPPNASSLAGFLVEGEQHYWVHVAIDRFTGQVIDKQIEVVNE